MANVKDVKQHKKGHERHTPITLPDEEGNEQTRYLRFDLNAFAELEEEYGDIETAMTNLEKGSIKALRAILWAGLLHEDSSLTPKQVGSWISIQDLPSLSGTLGEAIRTAMPVETEEGQAGPFEQSESEENNQDKNQKK